MSNSPPRVLVLDDHLRQALATVRALGKAGVFVGTAGYLEATLAGASRRAAVRHRLIAPGESASSFSEGLEELIAEHGYQVIFASDDGTIEQLRSHPPSSPCVPEVRGTGLDPLINKMKLGEIASEVGVPYPKTLRITDDRSVDEAIAELGLPLVLKPESSAALGDDRVLVSKGATIARSPSDALRTVTTMRASGLRIICQEYVDRIDKINVTIFRRSKLSEVRFPYRVLRDVPLTGGIAVAIETIPVDSDDGEVAVSLLERICDAAGYEGVANGEFCKVADGRLVLIEVNARPWGSLWFSERHGHRFSERCLRHALGQPGLPTPPRTGRRRFHHPLGEAQWILLHETRTAPLAEVVRTTRPWDVFEYVELRDPRPMWELARSVIGRHVGRKTPSALQPPTAMYRVGD